jgi:vitamin B12 transporter
VLALVFAVVCLSVPLYSQDSPGGYLDALVVTASKIQESLREVTSNVTIIDSAEVAKSPGSNLLSLLTQKGFQTYSFGGTNYGNAAGATLYIRGYGGSTMGYSEANAYTAVLLNGHRINNSYINMINLVNIDRIEIIRGPAAVQYGPSAMGGVVNIITKRGEGPLSFNASVGIGSFDKDEEQISLSGSYQGFDFSVGAIRGSSGDYSTGDGKVYYRTKIERISGLDVDFGYTFQENHRIGFHYDHQALKGEVPGWGTKLMQSYQNSFSELDNYSWNSTFSYTGSTSDKTLSWFANYTFAKTKQVSRSFSDLSDPMGYAPYYPEDNYNSISIVYMDQIQLQLTYDHPIFSLTGGFDFVNYKGKRGNRDAINPSFQFKDTAGYLIGKLRLLEGKLIVTAGGRYDSFKLSNYIDTYSQKNFSPSFGIAYSPVEFLKLRAQYSEGFSLPNHQQAFGQPGSPGYIANPDLKPQQNRTIEFGADVEVANFTGSFTYFISNFKNKFIAVPVAQNEFQFRNLEGATLSGLELFLSYDIAKALGQEFSLSPFVNLTWMTESKNKDATNVVTIAPKSLPNTPDLLVNYGINFEYPAVNLSAKLSATYFGKEYVQDYEDPATLASYYQVPPPWLEHGGFTVVDLSISKRVLDFEDKGHLQLNVKVGNLLDVTKAYNPVVMIPGRNFYVSLLYNY